jgi:hypothetical protein
MATTLTLRITSPLTAAQWPITSNVAQSDPRQAATLLENLLSAIKSGTAAPGGWSFEVVAAGAQVVHASQTYTFVTLATATKTFTINGVAFTAVAANPTGDQFLQGATKEDSANNLAAKINASTTAGVTGVICALSAATAASGTLALSTCVATDTATVGVVTFTMSADPTTAYDTVTTTTARVLVGASDAESAANLADAINNHPTLKNLVVATVSTATVTVTALAAGVAGNDIALGETGDGITKSGTTLTNGHDAQGPTSLFAAPDAGVVRVIALAPGKLGNAITTVSNDTADTVIVVGGATMAGGAGETTQPVVVTIG